MIGCCCMRLENDDDVDIVEDRELPAVAAVTPADMEEYITGLIEDTPVPAAISSPAPSPCTRTGRRMM